VAPLVAVPEAAMDEDRGAMASQHYVGSAGKVMDVQTVAKPSEMECPAQCEFRFGISTPDARHHPRAGCRTNDICHGAIRYISRAKLLNL